MADIYIFMTSHVRLPASAHASSTDITVLEHDFASIPKVMGLRLRSAQAVGRQYVFYGQAPAEAVGVARNYQVRVTLPVTLKIHLDVLGTGW